MKPAETAERQNSMADIVGIGCSIFDMMLILGHFPDDDEKTSAEASKVQCGGPCAVAMITASKLGITTSFQGKYGDDMYGLTTRDNLAKYGVDLSSVKIVPGAASPFCVVLLNQGNGHRACVGGGVWSPELMLREEEVDLEAIRGAKYLHIDGFNYKAAVFAAKKAKEAGVKVSMDLDEGGAGAGSGTAELVSLIDILIPSERSARALSGKEDMEEAAVWIYEKFRPETLVITMGPQGGIVMVDGEPKHYEAFPVKVIDSNGAGDVFHGAFLAAKVKGLSDAEAARFASAASAVKCTGFGASESAPDWKTVEAFLASR